MNFASYYGILENHKDIVTSDYDELKDGVYRLQSFICLKAFTSKNLLAKATLRIEITYVDDRNYLLLDNFSNYIDEKIRLATVNSMPILVYQRKFPYAVK